MRAVNLPAHQIPSHPCVEYLLSADKLVDVCLDAIHLCKVNREAIRVPHLKGILAIYILLALGLGGSSGLLEARYALVQGPVEAHLFLTACGAMFSYSLALSVHCASKLGPSR